MIHYQPSSNPLNIQSVLRSRSCSPMHSFQVYQDVPAIECGDGTLMTDPFVSSDPYHNFAMTSNSFDPVNTHSAAHVMDMERRLLQLTNSVNGYGGQSPIKIPEHNFSRLAIGSPQHYRNIRYMSPSGPMGGSLSSTDSTSDGALSPDIARNSANVYFSASQGIYPPSPYANECGGGWASQPLYQNSSLAHSPSSYSQHSLACTMKELQYNPDPGLGDDQDGLDDNDCIKVGVHQPEEVALSPETPASIVSHSMYGESASFHANDVEVDGDDNNDDDDNDDDGDLVSDQEEIEQSADADPDFNPRRPQQTHSGRTSTTTTTWRAHPARAPKRNNHKPNPTTSVHPRSPIAKRRRKNATPHPLHAHSSTTTADTSSAPPRLYTCPFAPYGCTSTFAAKNEWKRHIASQHLQLGFYRCDVGACAAGAAAAANLSSATNHPTSPRPSGSDAARLGPNDFNRRDLFTSHLRRMHAPWCAGARDVKPSQRELDAFNATLDVVRDRCFVQRRPAPDRVRCVSVGGGGGSVGGAGPGVRGCGKVFQGEGAWDQRLECGGKHVEGRTGRVGGWRGAGEGIGGESEDGGLGEDVFLREWAVREGVCVDWGTEGVWLNGITPPGRHAGGKEWTGRQSKRRAAKSEVIDNEQTMGEIEG